MRYNLPTNYLLPRWVMGKDHPKMASGSLPTFISLGDGYIHSVARELHIANYVPTYKQKRESPGFRPGFRFFYSFTLFLRA